MGVALSGGQDYEQGDQLCNCFGRRRRREDLLRLTTQVGELEKERMANNPYIL